MMNSEGAFPRLVDLIKSKRGEDWRLHKRLLELLYEMSRLQRLGVEDLAHVDDEFIHFQFQNIEELSGDGDDPYHYPVIRVLVCFAQCMQIGLSLTENSLCSTSNTWWLRPAHQMPTHIHLLIALSRF